MDYFICRTFSLVLSLLFSLTMDFVMSKIFFIRCIIFSLSHFPMSNKFCGSYNGVEYYLSNIICWQTCQTLLSICRKHSVALHKACRTFSVEHFDVENLPWTMGKCIVEHFLSKIVCFPQYSSAKPWLPADLLTIRQNSAKYDKMHTSFIRCYNPSNVKT